jgi:hypothetical protein
MIYYVAEGTDGHGIAKDVDEEHRAGGPSYTVLGLGDTQPADDGLSDETRN